MIRPNGRRLHVFNSGLEVWLYDDANRDAIRSTAPDSASGGMPGAFADLTRAGQVVGYGLHQDDELDVEVHVGKPFTEAELAVARWLAPQTAWLRLPSGRLCVESNDASRIGEEEPTDQGAHVDVPPGDYRLTLLRVDHEALSREKLQWTGPQEVILLSPGGKKSDAATGLLPFQQRRGSDWIGRYQVDGNRAEALAWFGDYWDTGVVNLDAKALAKLGLKAGMYFQVNVPAAGLTLVSVFAESWTEGRKLRPPAGVSLDNYGYAALSPMSEWNGAVALFCRREKATTRIEDEHHNTWLPASVEVLAAHPQAPKATATLAPSALDQKQYFDSGFLGVVLCDLLPGSDDLDEFPLPVALAELGVQLGKLGLQSQGDFEWEQASDLDDAVEFCCRLYSGKEGVWAAAIAAEGFFDFIFVSRFNDNTWLVTGLADDLQNLVNNARASGVVNQGISIQCRDKPLAEIYTAHVAAVAASGKNLVRGPGNAQQCAEIFSRFRQIALG